jgi:hypothetical protein
MMRLVVGDYSREQRMLVERTIVKAPRANQTWLRNFIPTGAPGNSEFCTLSPNTDNSRFDSFIRNTEAQLHTRDLHAYRL